MKKYTVILVSIFVILSLAFFIKQPVMAEGENGTTLDSTISINPHWNRTFQWTIDKSVSPDTLDMFKGDSGSVDYTITITKTGYVDEAWLDGQVCVTNGGEVATEGLSISVDLSMPPSKEILGTIPVDVSDNPVLDPGETGCYNYRIDLTNPVAGAEYKVTANITITNHSGHLGELFGPSPSASTNFLSTPILINDNINVDDTNGGSWFFSNSGSVSYTKTFSCNDDAGSHNNTATIRETGQSDSASVQVNCYELTVSKTAATSFTRTFNWTIDKTANKSSLNLSVGQIFEYVDYDVKVSSTFIDSNWAVQGTITISNPAPMDATLDSVTDLVSPDIAALVDCPSLIVPAEGSLECTYITSLPNAITRTNTATATLINTPEGTTDFTSPEVEVTFIGVNPALVDECITVTDSFAGELGIVCQKTTFTYSRTIGPYDTCGDYEIVNTASFITNDTETTGSDSWTVYVYVPCGGCTLTPGYWKTHSMNGPAPYDDAWAILGENTLFFNSGKTYFNVLWTAPEGNAYYILAHAYIGAKLNILNGADPSAIESIMLQAEAFLMNDPSYVATLKGKAGTTLRAQFINLAGILDSYNNGYIGPGHCSE